MTAVLRYLQLLPGSFHLGLRCAFLLLALLVFGWYVWQASILLVKRRSAETYPMAASADGATEKLSESHAIMDRVMSRRAQRVVSSAVLIALGWMLHSGITWAKYSQEHAAWQKSYAVWAARQPQERK